MARQFYQIPRCRRQPAGDMSAQATMYYHAVHGSSFLSITMENFLVFLYSQGYAIGKKEGMSGSIIEYSDAPKLIHQLFMRYLAESLKIYILDPDPEVYHTRICAHFVLAHDEAEAISSIPFCHTKLKRPEVIRELPFATMQRFFRGGFELLTPFYFSLRLGICSYCHTMMEKFIKTLEPPKSHSRRKVCRKRRKRCRHTYAQPPCFDNSMI